MDVRIAAQKTLEAINGVRFDQRAESNPDLSSTHVREMLNKLISGEMGNSDQANRWLGWAQAAAAYNGAGTIEAFKRINKES